MKPTVRFIPDKANFVKVGMAAHIVPIDHPDPSGLVDNGYPVWTSEVISRDESGAFETKNTKYVPDDRFKLKAGAMR